MRLGGGLMQAAHPVEGVRSAGFWRGSKGNIPHSQLQSPADSEEHTTEEGQIQ